MSVINDGASFPCDYEDGPARLSADPQAARVDHPTNQPTTDGRQLVEPTATGVYIHGLGLAVPQLAIAQQEAAQFASHFGNEKNRGRALQELYRRSGVRERHSVLLEPAGPEGAPTQSFYPPAMDPGEGGPTTGERIQSYQQHAEPLAREACRHALRSSRLEARQVSHLVTVSCTGFASPGYDLGLVETLGLRRDVARTHIGFMGCHAVMNALRVARAFAQSEVDARVLVCALELCSLHQQYFANAQQMVANALFADGAAAAVVAQGPTTSEGWRMVAQKSWILSETADLMQWRIGDHGFEMTLSNKVPDVIRNCVGEPLRNWLADCGLSVQDIRSWAVHPGGVRILSACAEGVGFDTALLTASRHILSHYGNMSSPTVLFILEQLRKMNQPRPCVMLAFGPGLTIEAALVE